MTGFTRSGARLRRKPNRCGTYELLSCLIRVSISGCFHTMSFESTMDCESPALAFPQHECGIFAVFGHPNAAVLTYYGLFALQHRGQESAGIVTSGGSGSTFQLHRDMGLV